MSSSSDSDMMCQAPSSVKAVIISVVISTVAYIIVLSLTLSYVPLLLKTSYAISRRMRNFLLVYVTFMATVSTVYFVVTIIAIRNMFGGSGSLPFFELSCGFTLLDWRQPGFVNGIIAGLCTLFASWGADGFMLWRCVMLYEGVWRPYRIALITFLVFIGLGSYQVFSLAFVLSFGAFVSFEIVIAATVFLNLVTATLITSRILYYKIYIQKTVGLERNSPYTTIIIICVESSALIVIFGVIYTILLFLTATPVILMQSMVHVYVISPLLIIYRVARGRAATIRQNPSDNGTVVSALHFEPPPDSPCSGNNEA
ncbi:hypothetical protein BYT27DRAFT_7145525 [Phlegmacium glaucopus]|nr:hypothetical protein BYT27DRAFT_7145525 [Phlegmacium glaucopus]